MQQAIGRIGFYAAACLCNIMVWGMFTVLNMPRFDVAAIAPVPMIRSVQTTVSPAVSGEPVRVVAADLGIDARVKPGIFDPVSKEWSLSDEFAYHAAASVPVNDNNGTTLIYGHAKPAMFESLRNVTPTMEVKVYTSNSKIFVYKFASMREVTPTDTSVFTQAGPPMLVLQTCSGPWDEYRALYSFDYVKVQEG